MNIGANDSASQVAARLMASQDAADKEVEHVTSPDRYSNAIKQIRKEKSRQLRGFRNTLAQRNQQA